MIRLPIVQEELEIARKESNKMGILKGSILKGEGNEAGFLGELAVHRYFGYLDSKRNNTYNHDLILGGFRFDVKTKRRTVLPNPDYCGTVPDYQKEQQCQGYIFTSVQYEEKNPISVTLCGWVGKPSFFRDATFFKKGDVNPENGWVCSLDCWCLRYRSMKDIQSLECGLLFK